MKLFLLCAVLAFASAQYSLVPNAKCTAKAQICYQGDEDSIKTVQAEDPVNPCKGADSDIHNSTCATSGYTKGGHKDPVFRKTTLWTKPAVATDDTMLVTMFSDSQCPCSAQFTADIKALLDHPDFQFLDFQQYFVGGTGKNADSKCIHGEGECVTHRHFMCAQNMTTHTTLGYRDSPEWLDFQNCSYGRCDGSAAVKGASHPCKTYTTFGEFHKNDIMKNCSSKLSIDWATLNKCGDTAQSDKGQKLMEVSAAYSASLGVKYGLQGLPVVHIAGMDGHVDTKQPIPITCGPTPLEVLKDICTQRAKTSPSVPSCCEDHSCIRHEKV